jgi:hypothetical protein
LRRRPRLDEDGCVPANQQYVSILVALDAALLLIVVGLAKKQLDWKRPELPLISRRRRDRSLQTIGPLPRRMRFVLVAGICVGATVASGAGLADAVAPQAAAAYVAAAAFALFATR